MHYLSQSLSVADTDAAIDVAVYSTPLAEPPGADLARPLVDGASTLLLGHVLLLYRLLLRLLL